MIDKRLSSHYRVLEFKKFDEVLDYLRNMPNDKWNVFGFYTRTDPDTLQKIFGLRLFLMNGGKDENLKEILEESNKNKIL